MTAAFAELVAATNYSFLRGASHAEDMVGQAIALGQAGIGIADRNSVAGVVRAHVALREARELGPEIDFKLAAGARLVFADGTPDIVAYPATRFGWGRLTRLLTVGNLRAEKGDCILYFDDLLEHIEDLLLIVVAPATLPRHSSAGWGPCLSPQATPLAALEMDPSLRWGDGGGEGRGLNEVLLCLHDSAPNRVWLGASMLHRGSDRRRLTKLASLAQKTGVPLLATNDALYAEPDQRPIHDILTCIREKTTIASAGRLLEVNAERHLKSPAEMLRLFRDCPEAVGESVALLSRIEFSLNQLRYEYPHEPVPSGWSPQSWLEHIVLEAANARYPDGLPDKLRKLLDEEFGLIARRQYAYYFLTVHDLVRFARSKGILCQGRGSAANSAVCYLLGVTSVDPMKYDLLFSRFVSEERGEPPDIDVDFEHERREEVMQYVYERYGRHRAGIAATVIHYRPRSAVREVGKALGLSEDVTARLSSTIWGSFAGAMEDKRYGETGFSLDNPEIARLSRIVDQLLNFPRHLSQHVGGFVLTEGRLDEMVPIHNAAMEDRTFIEWDKDDIDALGLMKVDVLALGMLTCIRKAFDLMRDQGEGDYALDTIPQDDPETYAMLRRGDSIGVFQVESRAQINMLPHLKPKEFYDLVIQVAIVRPGPIEGDMVHPYLRRRNGLEKVVFPSPAPPHDPKELEGVLGKTLGVPLFQEQAMKLAIVAAGFSPEDANRLRRAMATFRNLGKMHNFQEKMVEGMVARGYEREFAERCFKQIEGFGSYGFPESHALSFARLVYVSAWIKCRHPAVFACALLNSQPMGFYAPAQIVRDAREHGVEVRPPDINASFWDNSLESPTPFVPSSHRACRDGMSRDVSTTVLDCARTSARHEREGENSQTELALRLGFRQMDGFREDWAKSLVAARGEGAFDTVEALARCAALPRRALRMLADADACRSIGMDRRAALWDVRRTPGDVLPLFAAADARELGEEGDAALPEMPLVEHVVADYETMRLSLKAHPMAFLREGFDAEGVLCCAQTDAAKNGARVRTAGVVLVRQRPGKGNAIFVTIEDETGITNILIWARLFERYRRAVMASRLMLVEGEVQRSAEGVVHLIASRIIDRTADLARLSETHEARPTLSRADEFLHPQQPRGGHPRNVRILPKSRDFH